jgi:hypothetical protein
LFIIISQSRKGNLLWYHETQNYKIIDLVLTDVADFSFPAFFADALVRIYFIHTCTSILTRVQLAVIDICIGQTTHEIKIKEKKGGGVLGIN